MRRSPTDGKELRCLASEKRWQRWRTGYEIGAWRDGTSSTSPAKPGLGSRSLAGLVVSSASYLCTSPQFPSEFLFQPDTLVFLETFFFFFNSARLTLLYFRLSMAIAVNETRWIWRRRQEQIHRAKPIGRSENIFLNKGQTMGVSGICGSSTSCPCCPCYFDSHAARW